MFFFGPVTVIGNTGDGEEFFLMFFCACVCANKGEFVGTLLV